ncbi:MAG: enoyl-CoA hydratase [Alphaproteobacteria bacterium]|nr:enoyl-CoA hydratase [Alphaproteobacteria bacterium]
MSLPAPADRSDERILLRNDDAGVATLTLNRPAQRNALSAALMAELQAALDAIAADRVVRVVVIQASGPAFCAGHDLRELRATPKRPAYEALFRQCSAMMLSITRLPQPVIAKVQGAASAAGCQLVATCDLAVASRAARFSTPGVNIGLFCSTPMVALSRAIGRKASMEMLLTGEPVDADTAKALGLVNRVADPARLDAETAALARRIASKSPLTVKIGKEAFYRQLEMGLKDAYDHASRVMTENMLAADAAAGIDAFLDKKPEPDWQGK